MNVGVTTCDVIKIWYSLEGARKLVNIKYIHWDENSSQPMKDSLSLGYMTNVLFISYWHINHNVNMPTWNTVYVARILDLSTL